MKTSRELLKHT
jgi:hypothetical protein